MRAHLVSPKWLIFRADEGRAFGLGREQRPSSARQINPFTLLRLSEKILGHLRAAKLLARLPLLTADEMSWRARIALLLALLLLASDDELPA